MRSLAVIVAVCSSLFFYGRAAHDDIDGDEISFFERMEFDTVLRGAFNVSKCFEDLLTCYEVARPDMICRTKERFETMCSAIIYKNCDENSVFMNPDEWAPMALYQSVCVVPDNSMTR